MTYREYAEKNLEAMLKKAPSAQDMRDVALLSLWLNNQCDVKEMSALSDEGKEEAVLFPSLDLYKADRSNMSLAKLCNEIADFCKKVYASTANDEQRDIFGKMAEKISKY